jgi:hypothetical protein
MTALGLWLDWRLFGNGRGLASPYCDDVFYWLDGRFYKWIGGLGAQLQSYEWRIPKPGTRRRLVGREFVVFQASRNMLRVSVSWQIVGLSRDLNAANAEIRQLHSDLKNWNHGN